MLGVRLGIDVGKVRIGVARSDAMGMLATPVATVPRSLPLAQQQLPAELSADLEQICAIAVSANAKHVCVGLPLNLQGAHTPATADAIHFATQLAKALKPHQIPVFLVDERLSTKTAQQQLQQAGKSVKNSRELIDQAAAVIILQQALDIEKISGKPAGAPVAVER